MRSPTPLFLSLMIASPAFGEPPQLYREVTSVNWVVADADRVASAWSELGFPRVQDLGRVTLPVTYRGQSGEAVLRIVQSSIAGVSVLWFQPVSGPSIWADFLEAHGDGVMSVDYTASSPEALDAEAARLEGLGVSVLQTAVLDAGRGPLRIVHMDTSGGGKYAVGLTVGEIASPESAPPSAFGPRLSQYALVVRDMDAVSAYWAKLGLPTMEVTHPELTDLSYRGQPGRFDQKLGWHRHGTVTWEWIMPLAGPTVYEEFLDAHRGEGFHHLAFDVPDMDAAAQAWSAAGFPIVQSGRWGERDRPGSGRFAYADTTSIGGVTVELLWSYPGAD